MSDVEKKNVVVLGATGSIGTSSLEIFSAGHINANLVGISAHSKWEELAKQSQLFRPRWAVLSDETLEGKSGTDKIDLGKFASETEVLFGQEGIETIATADDVDVVISGIVGAAGLHGTWAAVKAGKTIGLANKETMVVAGPLVMALAKKSGATIIPVDSEHSAIFQALHSGHRNEVKRIVLTASGGPFRGYSKKQLEQVTVEDALKHPTWQMGPKITVDSATMMNKALEMIEAKWLFGLEDDQIEVVVHPQSIVHSFVEFIDGSVIAQLSPPDMKLPIQYAITYPLRKKGISPCIDWGSPFSLQFDIPDEDVFPALSLGREVIRKGGSCGAVLNAANELAVELFLSGKLQFKDIPRVCRAALDLHNFDPSPSLDELIRLDRWIRKEIPTWTSF
ncbi:1-deoxy-D-xylulose 5-phosphate reductoisomerase [hydrothermal vent metagenome]|uniref:1-deoxy-D-xylulose-5-phosphate reductoisomerase n=1 Tax=hydrothermal vent metagenome TaxID=652676 RepID=A0A3B1DKV7_9ZZZZ